MVASTSPVTDKLVPVAAPIFGVTKLAEALTATWLLPLISVVFGSTLTLIDVPIMLIPLPAVTEPAPENCWNTMLLVPITTASVVCTQPVSALTLPD